MNSVHPNATGHTLMAIEFLKHTCGSQRPNNPIESNPHAFGVFGFLVIHACQQVKMRFKFESTD